MHGPLAILLVLLSVASHAGTTPDPTGEFQCYEVKPGAFDPVPVTVQDRFGTLLYPVRFPHRLCGPTGGDPRLDAHLMGFEADGNPTRLPAQRIDTRFGSVTVDLLRPDLLLVPTVIGGQRRTLASPRGIARQCYRVDRAPGEPRFEPIIGVQVIDWLETVVVDLLEPHRVCTAASVNGEDPAAPGSADDLLCYTARSSASFGDERVDVQNRFGVDEARLIHRRELCVPVLRIMETTTTTTSTTSSTTTSTSVSTSTSRPSSTTLIATTTTSTSVPPSTSTTTTIVTTTTTVPPGTCGDGRTDAGEECDDGNVTAGDCCSPACRLEPDGSACGDDEPCNGAERCRAGRCEVTPACRSDVVLAAITNFRDDSVSLLDPIAGQVEAIVAANGGPWGVAFDPRGTEIWITNRRAKSLSVIDVAARRVVASIPVGRTPLGVVLDPSGARAYVASYGGDRIEVVDTASRTVIDRFAVDRGPSGVAFDPASDTLWVTSYGSDTVLALDAASGAVRARLAVGRKPTQLAVDATRGRLYVSSFGAGSVTVIDLARRAIHTTIRAGRKPFGVAVDAARARAYVSNAGQDTLTVIDTATDTVIERRRVAAGPLGVGVDPAGRILVTSGTGGVVSFLDPAAAGTGTLVVGALPVAFGSFVGTVGVRCPDARPCDAPPALAGGGALGALLEAAADTVRRATAGDIPDVALAAAVTDALARSQTHLASGARPALRRELRGLQRVLRRGIAGGGIATTTGSRLLDLVRRARALARRTGS